MATTPYDDQVNMARSTSSISIASRSSNIDISSSPLSPSNSNDSGTSHPSPSSSSSPSSGHSMSLIDRIKNFSFGRFKKNSTNKLPSINITTSEAVGVTPNCSSFDASIPSTSKLLPNTVMFDNGERKQQQNNKIRKSRNIFSHLCTSNSHESEGETSIIHCTSGANNLNPSEISLPSSSSSTNGQVSRPLYPTNLMILDNADEGQMESPHSSLPVVNLPNQISSNNNLLYNTDERRIEIIAVDGQNSTDALPRSPDFNKALRSQHLATSPYPYLAKWNEPTTSSLLQPITVSTTVHPSAISASNFNCIPNFNKNTVDEKNGVKHRHTRIHTQIDFVHCFVPDLLEITNFPFYWGKMDRYEAEKLLENKPEGTFLLRDSAQEDHLFSVSFRRFHRSLHARIEHSNKQFSFDSHDPGVFSSPNIYALIEHYKDPNHCMFFEPMLTIRLNRNFPFSLQHLARATICSNTTYDAVQQLHLPKRLKVYLQEYHYKLKVNERRFDN